MAFFSLRRETFRERIENLDWRVWLGLILTFSWLVLGYVYVETTVGWDAFRHLPVDQVGNFLEGGFAPLAFLWLVIGYFLQQRELSQNTEVLRMSVQQSEIQSEKMAANELHARQETFLRVPNACNRNWARSSASCSSPAKARVSAAPSQTKNRPPFSRSSARAIPKYFRDA